MPLGDRQNPDDLVLIAATAGPFGVRGEVRVRSFTAEPDACFRYGVLRDKTGKPLLTPKKWRALGEGFALTAPEIPDRTAAEAFGKTGLFVARDRLPPAAEDEFYHIDLIGCRVEALDGAALGEVRAVQNFGAGDLLELTTGAFLPFTKAACPIVDIAARRIVTDPPVAEDAEAP
jgi:16S rRNA processing protein RimM